MTDQSYYTDRANWSLIPGHMQGGVVRYVMHGVPPGGFLTALLANDFMAATSKADDANADAIMGWAGFLYNYVPADCKGSYDTVTKWCESGGVVGQRELAQ